MPQKKTNYKLFITQSVVRMFSGGKDQVWVYELIRRLREKYNLNEAEALKIWEDYRFSFFHLIDLEYREDENCELENLISRCCKEYNIDKPKARKIIEMFSRSNFISIRVRKVKYP